MTQKSSDLVKTRRSVLGAAAGLVGAGFTAGCSRQDSKVLRAVDVHPDGYPTVAGVRHLAKLLSDRSNGRLNVKVYPGGQLGQEKDTLEITIFGGLDFNRVNLVPLNSIARETLVPTLPFMFRSIEHMRLAMDGGPGNTILKSLEPHGLIGLCFFDSGARSFYTTSRMINEPSDLNGLKIRVQNSDLAVSMVEALGGDATPMAFGEVYQGLLQGVVDGAENNMPSYESTRHFEAAKFYSYTRHVMAPEVLVMSAKRWAKLTPDDQMMIRQCARESVAVMRQLWDDRVNASRDLVLASGVKLTEPDISPFQEKVQSVWDRYLDTAGLKELAASIQSVSE